MSPLNILYGSTLGALLFVAGFLVGLWLSRHNTRTIQPPKVEVVKVPEPQPVQKPPAAAPQKPVESGPFLMQPARPGEQTRRQEEQALGVLLGDHEAEL